MENLAEMDGWQDNVHKFTLSFEHRGLALEKLRSMNITRASLFRGLTGLRNRFGTILRARRRSKSVSG